MKSVKYTNIKSREQYDLYCNLLEELVFQDKTSSQDDIDLLTLLIEKWDDEHTTLNGS